VLLWGFNPLFYFKRGLEVVDKKVFELPFLGNVGLILTYKCQVSCRHCILEAGPNRTEEMTLNDALEWIEQISKYRNGWIKVVSLTGGEPFYDVEKLKCIANFASNKNLLVSVVTNAFWAKTLENARLTLKEVSTIDMLAISTDVYHQECIPLNNIANAALAAKEQNIPLNVHVCTENEEDENYRKTIDFLTTIIDKDQINTAVTFPVGRASKETDVTKPDRTTEVPVSACSSGNSPIIFPDGRIIACIGPIIDLKTPHPLILGNLNQDNLATILDKAEANPILHSIRVWGPKKLISMIKEAGFQNLLPSTYMKENPCEACYRLMSNPKIVALIEKMAQDPKFQLNVAYSRAFYLSENIMAKVIEEKVQYGKTQNAN
jgi:MoaA/NifB/PqqE/SkfB family radical SAM enzyme